MKRTFKVAMLQMPYGSMYLAHRRVSDASIDMVRLWLAPSDAKLVLRRSRWLQFTVEQIPHLWPTHGIVTPVSDTSEFALDRFGNHKTHQFDAYRTGRRVRASEHGDARV